MHYKFVLKSYRFNRTRGLFAALAATRNFQRVVVEAFANQLEQTVVILRAFTADAARELDVFRHDRHALGVDRAQVGIFEQPNQVRLGRLLQRQHRRRLKTQIRLEILRNLPHETLERQLANQKFRRLLVFPTRTHHAHARANQSSVSVSVSFSVFPIRVTLGLDRVRPRETTDSIDAPNLTQRHRPGTVSVRLLHPCVRCTRVHKKYHHHVSVASFDDVVAASCVRANRIAREGTRRFLDARDSRFVVVVVVDRFAPPVVGADLRAAFVASCFLGAFPPVDLRAVCFVRAMIDRCHASRNGGFVTIEAH